MKEKLAHTMVLPVLRHAMPPAPDIKRLLSEHNIQEANAEQRLAERGMHMMHSYLELVLLRLQSAAQPPEEAETDARLQALVALLRDNVRVDLPARV